MSVDLRVRTSVIDYLHHEMSLRRFVTFFLPEYVERSMAREDSQLLRSVMHALAEYDTGILKEQALRRRFSLLVGGVCDLRVSDVISGTGSVVLEPVAAAVM
jgi:hypothetical protein